MHIMLVEDDTICRLVIEATLQKQGHEVTSVENGPRAVDLLDAGFVPDLLLTDVQLAGDVDGWTVARLFQDVVPELPVIYMTGVARDVDPVSNSIYLLKPVSPLLLSKAIEAIGSATRALVLH